jgi:hypothetical protein
VLIRYEVAFLLLIILTEIQSLEGFIRDYSGTVKGVLEMYTDNMTFASFPLIVGHGAHWLTVRLP